MASFGHKDGFWENILQIGRRTVAAVDEAVKSLPLQYRLLRDERGAFDKYEQTTTATGLTIGTEADPEPNPFVYSHLTADILRDYIGRNIIRKDELLEITVGQEAAFNRTLGRPLKDGDVVVVSLSDHGITNSEREVVARTHRVREVDLSLIKYDSTIYTPSLSTDLPRDPVVSTASTFDLGADPKVVAVGSGVLGESVFVHVELLSTPMALPLTGNGDAGSPDTEFDFDAATRWESALTDDGGVTSLYANNDPGPSESYRSFFQVTNPSGTPTSAGVRVLGIVRVSPTVVLLPKLLIKTHSTVYQVKTWSGSFSSWVPVSADLLVNPFTGDPWTSTELTDLQIGLYINFYGSPSGVGSYIECTYLGAEYRALNPLSDFIGHVRYHVTLTDAPPSETEGLFDVGQTTYGAFYLPTAAGDYRFWASLYDKFGRRRAVLGPSYVTVT